MPIRSWRQLAILDNDYQVVAGRAIAAAHSSGRQDEFSGNGAGNGFGANENGQRSAARLIRDQRRAGYGVTSPRPTLMRAVSNVPSGFFTAFVILILAPGFSSLLSPAS